ncbi:MAG: hypothetical protein D3923_07905 [Candidatus Electrothrix sp. AR3]|nr:hypothetical protein [Candidatus Electrothrix sp. AR3]
MNDDLKRRDFGLFFLLMIITIGFYGFYLIPKLGVSVNHLIKKDAFKFKQVLLVGIFTLGLGLIVFEVMYAYKLENNPEYTHEKWSNHNLGVYVLILNMLALILAFMPGGWNFLLSCVAGSWATWLIQYQVNCYLDINTQDVALKDKQDTDLGN